MEEPAQSRDRAAAADKARRSEALAGKQDRILRLLDDEKAADEPAPAPSTKRTITYRGQTVEVDDAPAAAASPNGAISYRGSTVGDTAEDANGAKANGKRRGRRKGRVDADEVEEKLRRLKTLRDEGILTEDEFAAKKRELIELL